MDWSDAIFLGVLQGLTEFLPISSSAHLRIFGELTGSSDPGAAFTAITQIGTEIAVLLVFWKDIVRVLRSWFASMPWVAQERRIPTSNPDVRMGWMIIVGSLPIGILGILLQDWIDTSFRNLWITVAMLAIFGILLGLADRLGARKKQLHNLSWRDALFYGGAQAMALVPGVSRSGGTITMGRILGYKRPEAARYSFLLALPAIFASGFYKLAKVIKGSDPVALPQTLVATVIAFVVGYIVIVWFLKLISHRSFMPFVYYRLLLAAIVSTLLLTGTLQPVATAVATV